MPYGSAADLPRYKELKLQLKIARPLSLFMPKDVRQQIRDLPAQLERLVRVVDDFYALLGPAHWVFHDDLNVDDMLAIEREHAEDPVGAQTALIGWYQADDHLDFMIRRLNWNPAWRVRMKLIQSALEDYRAGRYYAVVQVLLSVMDGFVNDMDPARRKGLHAYEPEDIDPWDSVVGHHMGLAATQSTFRKTFKAHNDDPVHELYRNGIVHGMLTNYDNVVVATKAWNRLFAVSDWAQSLLDLAQEATKPPPPTIRESLRSLAASQERHQLLVAFVPAHLSAGDPRLAQHGAHAATVEFLKTWTLCQWGPMASLMVRQLGKAVTPAQVKADYSGEKLDDYRIDEVVEQSAAISHVHVTLTINGETFHPALRWIFQDQQGNTKIPGHEQGSWKLLWWGSAHMKRDAPTDAECG